jgi:hypothetical protein
MARGSPQQIALILRRKANALERAVREAEAASLKEAVAIARSLSTGSERPAALARRGHPLRIGGPGLPLPINLQSGSFYLGWRSTGPRKVGDTLRSSVVNESRIAKFVLRGTRRMQARPLAAAIRARTQASRMSRHRLALRAIHSGG